MSIMIDGRPLLVTKPPAMSGNLPFVALGDPTAVEDLTLGSLQSPLVRLRRELPLKVRRAAGVVHVSWEVGDLQAEAPSLALAIERFRHAVVATFLRLHEAGTLPDSYASSMHSGRI